MTMKTIQERLKSKGITPKTRHHNYDYLYRSIVQLMEELQRDCLISTTEHFMYNSEDGNIFDPPLKNS